MNAFSRISSVLFLLLLFTITSCNVSFDVLKRKYRPGYSLRVSNNNTKFQQLKPQYDYCETPETDSLQSAIVDDRIVASAAVLKLKYSYGNLLVF